MNPLSALIVASLVRDGHTLEEALKAQHNVHLTVESNDSEGTVDTVEK